MKEGKSIYVIGAVESTRIVRVSGWAQKLSFVGMEDGCCGVLLCFTEKKKAKKYAGKSAEVIELFVRS